MDLTSFTIIVLFLYLVGLKLISLVAYRSSSSTTEDYFLANRNVGTVAIIATTMASIFSTATVVGSPAEFYSKGVNFFWFFSFGASSFVIIPLAFKFWLLGKRYKFVTPGELTGDFYGSRAVQISTALIGIVALLPYATAQIVAVGKTFEALTSGSISYTLGVVIVTAAIGAYLYFGGSRAVILTDVVQGIIFACLIVSAGALCLYWSDGWENLISNVLSANPDGAIFSPNLKYYENILIAMSFFLLPHVWQRMYMARSANMLAKNICAFPLVILVLYTATFLIGSSAYSILDPGALSDSDNVLGAIFNIKAPYFGALILVAAFAAGMSTIDSQLLTTGAIVTRDLVPKKFFKDDLHQFKVARWITVAILMLCFALALLLKSQPTFALVILGISLTPIMMPAVYGMFFWKKATAAGAAVSMLSGLTIFIVYAFTPLASWFPFSLGAVSWSFLVACVSFVGVSLLTQSHMTVKAKRDEYSDVLSVLS